MNNPIIDKLKGAHRSASNPESDTPPPLETKQKRKFKTQEEKLADLQTKQKQLAEQVKNQQAKIKQEERKKDTRRKIVAGAIALEHMEHDENFRHVMEGLLKRHLKEKDLELFKFVEYE